MANVKVESIDRIIKRDDIRGKYPDDLNEEVAYYIGRAIVREIFASQSGAETGKPRLVVGWDARLSSPSLTKALIRGLVEEGAEVHELGQCSSELLYFATGRQDTDGGVMVTASHNPKDENGFKIVKRDAEPLSGNELKQIGEWVKKTIPQDPLCQQLTLTNDYVEKVLAVSRIRRESRLRLTVVVEAGNGMGGIMFKEVARCLPFLDVIYSNPNPDGNFPVQLPNPLKPEYRRLVQDRVVREGADLGLAFDGDADRVGVVDDKGEVILESEIGALIAERFLQPGNAKTRGGGRRAGGYRSKARINKIEIGYNLVCSCLVHDVIQKHSGNPWMTPVGHAQIKERMRKPEHNDCVFACEHSGHYFFRDFFCADSGMIAALMVIEAALAAIEAGSSLHQKVAAWRQKYFYHLEVNFRFEDSKLMKDRVEKVRQHYEEFGSPVEKYADDDPIPSNSNIVKMEFKEDFGEKWFCVRPSGNEPLLRLIVEVILDDNQVGRVDGQQLMEKWFNELVDLIGREYLEQKET